MGILTAHRVRGKEIFAFEYNESWMNVNHEAIFLDPNLGFYKGKQYQPEEKSNFGIFLDSAPDRWGRLLMRRREAWQAKIEGRAEKNYPSSTNPFHLRMYSMNASPRSAFLR